MRSSKFSPSCYCDGILLKKFPTLWIRTTVQCLWVSRETGLLNLRVVQRILQTQNAVKGLHNCHEFFQNPAAYYAKKRVYIRSSKHIYQPIRARVRFYLVYVFSSKFSIALVNQSYQCVFPKCEKGSSE